MWDTDMSLSLIMKDYHFSLSGNLFCTNVVLEIFSGDLTEPWNQEETIGKQERDPQREHAATLKLLPTQ